MTDGRREWDREAPKNQGVWFQRLDNSGHPLRRTITCGHLETLEIVRMIRNGRVERHCGNCLEEIWPHKNLANTAAIRKLVHMNEKQVSQEILEGLSTLLEQVLYETIQVTDKGKKRIVELPTIQVNGKTIELPQGTRPGNVENLRGGASANKPNKDKGPKSRTNGVSKR